MAIGALATPYNIPDRVVPFDQMTAFANPQTLTATGYVNAIQAQVDVGQGRIEGYWCLNLTNLKVSSGDEKYWFFLLGSNDATWTSGNIDVLACRDFASTAALRIVPTIAGISPTVPLLGKAGTPHVIPYTNFIGGFVFRYIQCYVIIAGTSPTVTLQSWLTYDSAC